MADTSSRLRARSGPFRSIKQALLQRAKDDADEATWLQLQLHLGRGSGRGSGEHRRLQLQVDVVHRRS
eukprot:COSAG06_NODE_1751_length_8472_cov_19.492774_4_plen_68_part_00